MPTEGLHADVFKFGVTGCLTGRRRRGSGMLTKGRAELSAGHWTFVIGTLSAFVSVCERFETYFDITGPVTRS